MRNLRYRTGLKRLEAAIIDGIVFLPLVLIGQWLLSKTNNSAIIVTWSILTAFLPLFYSVFCHYKYGQTIGKWVAGVKVLDIAEENILTLKQAILRDSFYLAVEIIGAVYFALLVFKSRNAGQVVIDYRDFTNQPLFWWTILELVTMMTNRKRRAVHDFLAKSVVVQI